MDAPLTRFSPRQNQLLNTLPERELRALEDRFIHVRLRRGRSLYEPGESRAELYFPTAGIVSVHYTDRSGKTTELTQVGSEGMVGLPYLLGGQPSIIGAVVQATSQGYRLPLQDALPIFSGGGHFQMVTLRYALAFMMQVSQTAVCNLHHSLDQHLCRWLLLCLDRLPGNEIRMTHELIAGVLGARRQGVTEAAQKLEKRKIITYFRGSIRVLDRPGLERCACECYAVAKRETARLLAVGDWAPGR